MSKKNFKIGDVVVIHSTTSTLIDGATCTVIGKSFQDVTDVYIVLLDEPVKNQRLADKDFGKEVAIQMVEACLRPIADGDIRNVVARIKYETNLN